MNEKSEKKDWLLYVTVFLIALLPKLVISLTAVPMKTFSDEVATITSAAYLAGYDWSSVVSHAGYYGQGFHFIFAPLFMITDNPVIIYRVVLSVYAVLQAMVAPISYHLMKKYYKLTKKEFMIPASIACSYLIVTRAALIFNEHILILCVWLAAWIMLELQECIDQKWKKRGYTILLVVILSYCLLLHTRAVALWIGLVICVLGYWLKNRKWLVSTGCSLVAGMIGYFGSKAIVRGVQSLMWNAGNGGQLLNTSITLTTNVKLNSLRTWKAWISIILGQLKTLNLFTAGLGVLCILVILTVLFSLFRKQQEDEDIVLLRNNTILFLLLGSCAAMTLLGQSISWLAGMSDSISHGPNSKDYGLKVVVYLRYFAIYLGPVFMGCLCWIEKKKEDAIGLLKSATIISVALLVYWAIIILPFAYENIFTAEFLYSLSAYQVTKSVELKNYIIGLVWMILGLLVTYTLIQKKKINQLLVVLSCFLIYQYCGNSMRYEINREEINVTMVNAGYEYVKDMEQDHKKMPKQIYCYDGSKKTNHQVFYAYQFVLSRHKIIPVFEKDGSDIPEGAMVLSNVPISDNLVQRGFTERKLDNNEYVYIDKTEKE